MKEKSMAFLTLGIIFSLLLYYKINPANTAVDVSVSNDKFDTSEYVVVEIKDEENDITLMEEEVQEPCSSSQKDVDKLSFSEAFKYHRNCVGTDMTFTWKGDDYTTVLASESEINDSIAVDDMDKNLVKVKADKTHLKIQNEMYGATQK